MSSDSLPEALPDPTVRFRLRTLIVGMTLAAAVAAIAGPIYRAAIPAARAELLTFWGTVLAIISLFALFHWRGSYMLACAAGPARYRLRRPDCPSIWFSVLWGISPLAWASSLALVVAGAVFFSNTLWLTQSRLREADYIPEQVVIGLFVGLVMGSSAGVIWRTYISPRMLKLCDHGILIADRVIPWGSILHGSWHILHPTWLMISTWTRPYAVEVPAEQRDKIEAFVRARCVFNDEQPLPQPPGRGSISPRS